MTKRPECKLCKLYHSTSRESIADILEHGLKGYGEVQSGLEEDHPIEMAIREADTHVDDAHQGAVFFYNDWYFTGSPFGQTVVLDVRDLDEDECEVIYSSQEAWERLVGVLHDPPEEWPEEDYEGLFEKLAEEYLESFGHYPCCDEDLTDEQIERLLEREWRFGDLWQVMVFCEKPIPLDILEIE